jgi:hypothetical protein
MKKPLPLTSPNWWPHTETLTYCRSRPLFRLQDLADAVDQEQVHSKLDYLDQSTRPAKRIAMLLTSDFFQREAAIIPFWDRLALKDRTVESRKRRPYALYFWGPDVKKLWPSDAEPAPKGLLPTDTKSTSANRPKKPHPKKPHPKRPPTLARQRTKTILEKLFPKVLPPEHKVATADIMTAIKGEWKVLPNPQHVRPPSDNTLRAIIKDRRTAEKQRAP